MNYTTSPKEKHSQQKESFICSTEKLFPAHLFSDRYPSMHCGNTAEAIQLLKTNLRLISLSLFYRLDLQFVFGRKSRTLFSEISENKMCLCHCVCVCGFLRETLSLLLGFFSLSVQWFHCSWPDQTGQSRRKDPFKTNTRRTTFLKLQWITQKYMKENAVSEKV